MVNEDTFQSFVQHYLGFRDAMYHAVPDPLSFGQKWYDPTNDEEDEEKLIRERVSSSYSDLVFFLKTHWTALSQFTKLEEQLVEGNYPGVFSELSWLLDAGETYRDTITRHQETPNPYLRYPGFGSFNRENTNIGFFAGLQTLRNTSTTLNNYLALYPKAFLPQLPSLNLQMRLPLHPKHRRVPNWMDLSYWGRLATVHHELYAKFRFPHAPETELEKYAFQR